MYLPAQRDILLWRQSAVTRGYIFGTILGGLPVAGELENAQNETGFLDLFKESFDDSLFGVIAQPIADAAKQGMQDGRRFPKTRQSLMRARRSLRMARIS